MTIIPTSYFPPIHYFIAMKQEESVLDVYENYIKQTYRNRCEILGANGVLSLIVPLEKTTSRVIKDKQISYAENWQKIHRKSFQSAYQRSPYYEYYEDKLLSIFNTQHKYLIDLNQQTLSICLDLLKLNATVATSTQYQNPKEENDLRKGFSSKYNTGKNFTQYSQVFEDRFEFKKNLSIFDLICNKGPQSETYLIENQLNT